MAASAETLMPSASSGGRESRNPDRVLDALSRCTSFEDVRGAGILFHGTCESLEGPLRGGGYDGVFWTASQPSIAQAYIPKAGISTWIRVPKDWEKKDFIRPSLHSDPVTAWACHKTGVTLEDLDIETDALGRTSSWSIPTGWPRQEDVISWMERLGYEVGGSESWEVSMARNISGDYEVMPADWKMPGHLVIALPHPDFRIWDPSWSESELGNANHNRVTDFARFTSSKRDAFRMQDLLQSDFMGNVGHEAIGILPSGLERLDWIAIPATRHDGADMEVFREPETEDFVDFMRDVNPEYKVTYDLEQEDFSP